MAFGGLGSFLFGQKPRTEQIQRFDPQQESIMNQLLQMGLGGMQDPTQGFEPIAQQARTQFQSQTVPSLAERFTSMGAGAQRSSAFQGALGRAGAGLEQGLAAQGAQFGLQRQSGLQQLLGLGLQPKFDSIYRPETTGFLGGAAQQALPGLLGLLFPGLGQTSLGGR